MARPEFILRRLEDFEQRGRLLRQIEWADTPGLQARGQFDIGEPVRGERHAALWMIRRAQPGEFPENTWEGAVFIPVAFAPPTVPQPAEITIRAGLAARQFFG